MRDRSASVRIKIDRANEHIQNLESEIRAFRERKPYALFREDHVHPYGLAFLVGVRERIPDRLSAIAADAVHNLHVALDHLWKGATLGNKERRKDPFPIYASPEEARARLGGKEKGNRKTAADILRAAKAFDTGNPFFMIREFNDSDKHHSIALVAVALTGFSVNAERIAPNAPPLQWLWVPAPHQRRVYVIEDGAVLYALHPTPDQMDIEPELSFEIAFEEGGVFQGEAVLPTLRQLTGAVEGLFEAFSTAGLLT